METLSLKILLELWMTKNCTKPNNTGLELTKRLKNVGLMQMIQYNKNHLTYL